MPLVQLNQPDPLFVMWFFRVVGTAATIWAVRDIYKSIKQYRALKSFQYTLAYRNGHLYAQRKNGLNQIIDEIKMD